MASPEPASSPKLPTAWHPPFVAALKVVLPEPTYEIHAEVVLNHQPQRIDIIVRLGDDSMAKEPAQGLEPVVRHLGRRVTAIEFKGPTVELRAEDLLVLLGYAFQYRVQYPVLRADLSLILIARRLSGPFWAAVRSEGGVLYEESEGVHVVGGLCHPLCILETSRVQSRVLQIFSPRMVHHPAALFALLTESERAIFRAVFREVKRFQHDPSSLMKYADSEEMTMSMEELMDEILDDTPAEKLLKRLSPEQRLKDLSPEQRLKGLSPEDMLKRLSPEQRLKGLSPQDLDPELREFLKKLLS